MDGASLTRILDNFYKAAFERTPPKQNQVLSTFITNAESQLAMAEVSGQYNVLGPMRAYAPLTIDAGTGITYNGGATTAQRIRYGAGILDETQGWFAIRLVPSWAYNDFTLHNIMAWQVDGTHRIALYKSTASQWIIESANGAANSTGWGATHASGAHITLIAKWDATTIGLSLNGSAFTSANRTAGIPVLDAATTIDFGSIAAADKIVSQIMWMMAGTGVLTDADAADIYARGDVDPVYGVTLGYQDAYDIGVTFAWPGLPSAHDPLSNRAGENVAA